MRQIKDHRDAKPHIVAGACERFLIDVALHRYLLVGADLPALEIGIIIFHLETVVLINFPTDRDTTVICIFFRKFSKKVVFFCFHNLFTVVVFYYITKNLLEFLRRLDL